MTGKKKHLATITLAALLAASLPLQAATILDEGDVDIGIGYNPISGWDLHVHKEDPPDAGEYEADDVVLRVNPGALTSVPAGAEWGFLGSAGAPVWILPNVSTAGLLFLGWATEEIAGGLFVNDEIALTLKSVDGPGRFAVFSSGIFGPTVFMNSGDGISSLDQLVLPVDEHLHFNVAFTAPGDYTIGFAAAGTLVDGNIFTESSTVDYSFTVVPEPTAATLAGLGIVSLLLARRRKVDQL